MSALVSAFATSYVPSLGLAPPAVHAAGRCAALPRMEVSREEESLRVLEEELAKLKAENEQLMSPTRRDLFKIPFAIGATWSTYKAVTSPSFDFPGLDSLKEATRAQLYSGPGERAVNKFFPGNLGSSTVDHLVARTLSARGFTPENTLFATSTCPDEVNTIPGELTDLLQTRWGENFALGGLGGVPFVGKAGLTAYSHHVPDSPGKGKMFIVFAPHVGVEADGKVGALKRVNQEGVSTACGASIGAYNGIIKEIDGGGVPFQVGDDRVDGVPVGTSTTFDAQIEFIKQKLKKRIVNIEETPDRIAYITYLMYGLAREYFVDEVLKATPGIWDYADELTVMGGIMVNRPEGGDRFMPLMFQTRSPEAGSTVDLYDETFGTRPDLTRVLQNDPVLALKFYDYDLETSSVAYNARLKKTASLPSKKKAPCVDSNPEQCPLWATAGECTTNAAFMSKECALSCDMCPP